MSILIKGIEMPTERESFNLIIKYNGVVLDTETGMQVAEAHELPPHGRLGDLDKLVENIDGLWDCNDLHFQPNDRICDPEDCKGCKWRETWDCFRRMVKHAPTIIPAEEGET